MRSGVRLSNIPYQDFFSNPGSPDYIIYTPTLENGSIVLTETGKSDIPTMINSYRDQTDMSLILARLAAGDASVLQQRQALYGDFSQMPNNPAAMLQSIMDAHNHFDHLPDEIKDKFHGSFSDWFGSAGSPEWAEKMTSARFSSNSGSPSAASAADPAQAVSAAIDISTKNEGGLAE